VRSLEKASQLRLRPAVDGGGEGLRVRWRRHPLCERLVAGEAADLVVEEFPLSSSDAVRRMGLPRFSAARDEEIDESVGSILALVVSTGQLLSNTARVPA